jgi:hypothetical protein
MIKDNKILDGEDHLTLSERTEISLSYSLKLLGMLATFEFSKIKHGKKILTKDM